MKPYKYLTAAGLIREKDRDWSPRWRSEGRRRLLSRVTSTRAMEAVVAGFTATTVINGRWLIYNPIITAGIDVMRHQEGVS
ncbi:MAG: hypothetical protein KJ630_10625 [Proteobacteria bacterium]|nr:hypothetical protein [Pseudomonadota bacterium]